MGYDALMASERWWGAASILLALLTVLVFIPGLSDEFTWDDNGLIRTNENIQRPERYGEALTSHFWNVSSDAVHYGPDFDHAPFGTDGEAYEKAVDRERSLAAENLVAAYGPGLLHVDGGRLFIDDPAHRPVPGRHVHQDRTLHVETSPRERHPE